ncbi:PucR family transcriptional regulator [Paludifilum halophilum]|uniref:PucR C-terminal helix-turn-helix domain-containing protein n=1 Tax=Paludifilum halophilum TaxID=1642702 RepID=A0A235B753_9BACL|nr:helix-turn-helix domain-containing protein [Paludifilum halophilum]OYD08126.1 hypothetical protein CHM34_08430 [Paludifilum halophilum]
MFSTELIQWVRSLERILGQKVALHHSRQKAGTSHPFMVMDQGGPVYLSVLGETLTRREEDLIRLLLVQWEEGRPRGTPSQALARWLRRRDAEPEKAPPPTAVERLDLNERIPFLVIDRGTSIRSEEGLVRLLIRYFDRRAWIIPYNPMERMVLVPRSTAVEEEGTDPETSWLEGAEGLAEVVTSEAGVDAVIGVHPPVSTAEQLPCALESLREAYRLGRVHAPGRRVFASWQFPVERLLERVERPSIDRYLHEISKSCFWKDEDLRETLTVFFEQNLNISETARRLYVHRNTLIYRLDRMKRETGLDVRQLEDAFCVRLALALTQPRNRQQR